MTLTLQTVGIRTLSEAQIDFTHSRNLIVVSLILVLGLGGAKFPVSLGGVHFELHGMALAALVGILANALLPPPPWTNPSWTRARASRLALLTHAPFRLKQGPLSSKQQPHPCQI